MSKVLIEKLKILKKKRPDQTIIFFFDSIDQLNKRDFSLEWIIKEFPSNSKFVFSTLNNYGSIIENLKRITTISEKNYLNINTLEYETAVLIFNKQLAASKKTLTNEQKDQVSKLLQTAELYPLYINLLFNIVSNWNSFDKVPTNISQFNAIEACIKHIFQTMENDYGKLLVSRCLFYLTSSDESGISDVELEDVLSLDDELLNHLFKFHLPPIRKFPVTLWNRIKYNLKDYIIQREIYGVNVNCWYHRKFLEVARSMYVDKINDNLKDQLCLNFLDVFNETYKTKAKPFVISDEISKRNGINNVNLTAVRYTSNQPIKFLSNNIERYNIRKINKVLNLASQLKNAALRSKVMLEDIFLNYDFITAAFKNYFDLSNYLFSENSALIDFMICFSKVIYSENDHLVIACTIIQQIMMFNSYWFNKFPDSMPLQMCSRVLNFYGVFEHVTKFIDECDKKSPKDCALIPTFQNQVQSDAFFKVLHDFHKNVTSYQACGYANKESFVLLDFYLCENSVYKFYWHGNEYERSEVKDEISLPITNDSYILLRVFQYTMLGKDVLHGLCAATSTQVFCFDDSGSQISNIETNDEIILDLMVIGHKCLLLFYKEREYFDVFNINTGKCLKRETFEEPITMVTSNVPKNNAWRVKEGKLKSFYLGVIVKNSSIYICSVACDLESEEMIQVEIKLDKIFKRKFSDDNKIIDCMFESAFASQEETSKFRFIATFNGMKCLLITLTETLAIYGVKPSLYKNIKDFKVLSFAYDVVFLQGGDCLLVFDLKKGKWFTIPGRYDNAVIDYKNNDVACIYCSTGNSLYTYAWNTKEDSFSYIQLMKPFEFYDQVFDMHVKSNYKFYF